MDTALPVSQDQSIAGAPVETAQSLRPWSTPRLQRLNGIEQTEKFTATYEDNNLNLGAS